MLENDFQAKLIKDLKKMFPEAIITKEDANYKQGLPDILILNGDRWAALEVKRSSKASKRPNQEYYVNKMNSMSYAAFVSPENKEMILNELQSALKPSRPACLFRGK